MCWNKGRLCWKIARLFYFCHLKKLVRPETFGSYYVPAIIAGRTTHLMFHIHCNSVHELLYPIWFFCFLLCDFSVRWYCHIHQYVCVLFIVSTYYIYSLIATISVFVCMSLFHNILTLLSHIGLCVWLCHFYVVWTPSVSTLE